MSTIYKYIYKGETPLQYCEIVETPIKYCTSPCSHRMTYKTNTMTDGSSKCNITSKYPVVDGALIEPLETAAYLSLSEAGKESSEQAFLDMWAKGTENPLPFTFFWWHSETSLALFRY